ncbi:MAG TPA: hypothetical protein VFG62_25975 [Rhodopila sp.]|jgi:hypothetical protein|nr:hypothetical protein [Rhodopila sp.]
MTSVAMPLPPRPFRVDANSVRLARVKAAALEERRAADLRNRGFIARATDLQKKARDMKECA